MEHLRKAVELVTVIDGSELNLSISIGVSRWLEDGAHFSQIYKTTDARLYQAKTLGRNKVITTLNEQPTINTEASIEVPTLN